MEKLRETAEAHGVFFTKHYHLLQQTDFFRSQDHGVTDKHEKFSGEPLFTLLLLLMLGEEGRSICMSCQACGVQMIVQTSLHHVDPKNQTQVVRPDGKHLTH